MSYYEKNKRPDNEFIYTIRELEKKYQCAFTPELISGLIHDYMQRMGYKIISKLEKNIGNI